MEQSNTHFDKQGERILSLAEMGREWYVFEGELYCPDCARQALETIEAGNGKKLEQLMEGGEVTPFVDWMKIRGEGGSRLIEAYGSREEGWFVQCLGSGADGNGCRNVIDHPGYGKENK